MFDKVKVFRGGPPDSIGWTALARFAGDTTSAHGPFTSALDPDFAYQFTGRRDAWAVVEPRIDELYPRTFDWMCFGGPEGEVIETVPLFGDLIDAARLVVDQADDDDYDGADLERFTGFAPATNAQRHILRVAKKGVSLLDILPTLSSPRTPWTTGTGTPSPNTPGRRSLRLS